MCAEWCEVRWRFWEEMIKFHGSDSELGIIWLCCMYSLLYYLELVCQRSIRSVAAIYKSVKKKRTNKCKRWAHRGSDCRFEGSSQVFRSSRERLVCDRPSTLRQSVSSQARIYLSYLLMFSFRVSVVSFFRYFIYFFWWGIRFLCLPTLQSAPVLLLLSDPLTAGCCRWLLVICLCVMVPCCALQKKIFAVQLATIRRVALCRSAAVMLCKYWNLTHASNQEGEKKWNERCS